MTITKMIKHQKETKNQTMEIVKEYKTKNQRIKMVEWKRWMRIMRRKKMM